MNEYIIILHDGRELSAYGRNKFYAILSLAPFTMPADIKSCELYRRAA